MRYEKPKTKNRRRTTRNVKERGQNNPANVFSNPKFPNLPQSLGNLQKYIQTSIFLAINLTLPLLFKFALPMQLLRKGNV